ncbi:hypothetical protein EJ05DRAFT_37784 [Pseudovirgaria hyperparasitica]|uniref:Uncharacterized protein n=1 Tax=Pseudovirgaria hyperparasitica TaxID=470096 RepID=A0A6A6WMH6_9PEZI|nr:uncharacterized protein EJ05DRAFT_37784 [Pseudovirgaria hyperparasitica]KAF2763404.1 hypothetical protein EJ05DRAFT_37784 [Pseudovirgaria hyperparasitica]
MYTPHDDAEAGHASPNDEGDQSAIYLPVIETVRPGQNAFAIEKRHADEHRMRGNAFFQERMSASREQLDDMCNDTSTNDPPSHQHRRDTSETTFSQLINAAKAEVEALPPVKASMEGSPERTTTKERRRPKPLELEVNKYGVNPTVRASIEAKNEKKLFQMMGEPTTPTLLQNNDRYLVTIARHDRTREKPTVKKDKSRDKPKDGERSPTGKKRFLGMNISVPNFRTERGPSSPQPDMPQIPQMPPKHMPHMPPKAAALLGNSCSPGKRSTLPQHLKSTRSQSNVSIPIRPTHISDPFRDSLNGQDSQRSRTRLDVSEGIPPTIGKQNPHVHGWITTPDMPIARGLKYINETLPPTPPAKDTPMLKKPQPAAVENCPPNASVQEELNGGDEVGQEPKHDPNDRESVLVGKGQVSSGQPQFNIYSSSDYNAMMAKMSQIYSAPTYSGFGQLSTDKTSPEPVFLQGRWSEGQAGAHQQKFLEYHHTEVGGESSSPKLPPTFYTPSLYSLAFPTPKVRPSQNADSKIFFVKPPTGSTSLAPPPDLSLTTKPSGETIDVCFQGYRNEVTPVDDQSSFWEKAISGLHISDTPKDNSKSDLPATGGPSQHTTSSGVGSILKMREEDKVDKNASKGIHHTPQQNGGKALNSSESGLTPFLSQHQIDSPMMRRYNAEGVPHTSSAAPSPLQTHPASAHPTFLSPITNGMLADGSNIVTHFGVTNHHMDAIADTTYRVMDAHKNEEIQTMNENHEATMQALNKQFGTLLGQVKSLENSNGRLVGDVANATVTISKLMDTVQKDLIRPLNQVLKSNASLESDVSRLNKSFSDVESKVDKSLKLQQQLMQQMQLQQQLPHNDQHQQHQQHQQHDTLTPNSAAPNGESSIHASSHYSAYGASNGNASGMNQSAMSFPEWGGYPFSMPLANVRNMKNEDPEKFKNYAAETGRMYGGQPDMRQHPGLYVYPQYGGGYGQSGGNSMK